jgi:hypothetical protein
MSEQIKVKGLFTTVSDFGNHPNLSPAVVGEAVAA